MISNRKANPYVLDKTELDVSRFVGSPSYELAVVVHRETEARRTLDALEFREKHGEAAQEANVFPGLLGHDPYDASKFCHWGEYATSLDVLMRCRETLGEPIGDVVKRIAVELRPDNAETIFWMGAWLETLNEKSDVEVQLKKKKDEFERVLATLTPLAQHGQKFKDGGRKSDSLGPVARKVQDFLARNRKAGTESVWAALKKSPPRGHVFVESEKLGRYIELGAKTVMEWPRFRNVVSERRAALRKC